MRKFLYAILLVVVAGVTPPFLLSWGQGAGPIGRPPFGGNFPENLDTISPLLTAATTQTQAAATFCPYTICVVGTVANAGNGVSIKQCTMAPMRVTVVNIGANSLQVYGSGTDTLNGIATGTGIALPQMTSTIKSGVAEFTCVVGGTAAQWVSH